MHPRRFGEPLRGSRLALGAGHLGVRVLHVVGEGLGESLGGFEAVARQLQLGVHVLLSVGLRLDESLGLGGDGGGGLGGNLRDGLGLGDGLGLLDGNLRDGLSEGASLLLDRVDSLERRFNLGLGLGRRFNLNLNLNLVVLVVRWALFAPLQHVVHVRQEGGERVRPFSGAEGNHGHRLRVRVDGSLGLGHLHCGEGVDGRVR